MRKLINGIFVVLGAIFLALGAIGTVIPLLPTVPFLIGAAICFARGSQRFYDWFAKTKLYRDNLESLVEHRAMTKKQKARALGLMTVMMGLAAVFIPNLHAKIGLVAVIVFNYILFAVGIRTISEEEAEELRQKRTLEKEEEAKPEECTVDASGRLHRAEQENFCER